MEVKEALLRRRSIRRFTDETVSDEQINELMHAAMSGPSACNKTPWEFYIITNQDTLALLRKASPFTNITAPLAIVVCGNLTKALPKQHASYWIQDCSAASENILLRATDMGLGTVWCGIHPQERAEKNVKEALGLNNDLIPLNIIYVGHPEVESEARDQYKEELIHYIK